MLYYDNQSCPFRHLLQLKGSVFPRSMRYALPSVVLSIAVHVYLTTFDIKLEVSGGGQMWTGYNMALSFLLVFRTQQAYSRWWEGGTLLQQIRGEWYNATSSLFAFTSADEAKKGQVHQFQHLIVRLMSLLYCSALQEVSMVQDEKFKILDTTGLDENALKYLRHSPDRCAVILQWIQRSVVTGMDAGVVPVAPPVVSRVFQELGRGMVNLHNVKKIREFPFPFPYAQMITFMLVIHWIITPVGNLLLVSNSPWSIVLSFISVLFFWSINYIAIEIELPFGDAVNHLPIKEMQTEMNRSLKVLLDRRSQTPPSFTFDGDKGTASVSSIRGVTKFQLVTMRDALAGVAEEDEEENSSQESNSDDQEEEGKGNADLGLVAALSGVTSRKSVAKEGGTAIRISRLSLMSSARRTRSSRASSAPSATSARLSVRTTAMSSEAPPPRRRDENSSTSEAMRAGDARADGGASPLANLQNGGVGADVDAPAEAAAAAAAAPAAAPSQQAPPCDPQYDRMSPGCDGQQQADGVLPLKPIEELSV